MTIRPMTHADIADGLRLCRASNWNQLEDDWRVFLDRGGGLLAVEGGEIVGSVAWLPFGGDFTWLSMMLVDPAARRGGIGSRLMEAALGAIGPDAFVRLDATPAGEPLYRRFGFTGEYELARTQASGGLPSAEVRLIAEAELESILARDREVFGADRGHLLRDLYRRAPRLAYRSESAYCFGRPGFLRPQIGPVVAESPAAARELVSHLLAVEEGVKFTLDLPRRDDGLGFAEERPFLRMCRGEPRVHGFPEHVFAITGPEFG